MKLILLFLAGTLFFAGCTQETIPVQKDRETLLTQLPWRLTTELQRVGALPAWGANSHFPANCEADNLYRFTFTGLYTITEGPTKCISTYPDIIASEQWIWLQTNSLLIGNVRHTIERLDDNNLVLVFPRTVGGKEIQVKWFFVH
jgi:hypothetical protein